MNRIKALLKFDREFRAAKAAGKSPEEAADAALDGIVSEFAAAPDWGPILLLILQLISALLANRT